MFHRQPPNCHFPDCGRGGSSHGGLFQDILELILRLLVLSKIPYTTNSTHCISLTDTARVCDRLIVERFFSSLHSCCSFTYKDPNKTPIIPISPIWWMKTPRMATSISYLQLCLTQVSTLPSAATSSTGPETLPNLHQQEHRTLLSGTSTLITVKQIWGPWAQRAPYDSSTTSLSIPEPQNLSPRIAFPF